MKGYKAFDKDLKCKDMQYEIGKTYELSGNLKMCINGFHYCETIADCYKYYPTTSNTRICEIEATGDIEKEIDKYCTNKITIIRELDKVEHLNGNVGINNMGYANEGYGNKGNHNKGDYNEGDCNKGDSNKGNSNKGDCNKGNYNIGIANVGEYQVGICCTNAPLMLFNKPSKHSLKELLESGVIDDLIRHILTDKVKALDTFDINVWNDLVKKQEET